MPDAITRGNETARKRAVSAGRLTYQHTFTDAWPACTDCATPIRHRDGGPHRSCGCPGVRWWCDSTGWRRIPEATNG